MVRNVLGMIAGGYTVDRVLEAYPDLSRDDVIEALEYATCVDSVDRTNHEPSSRSGPWPGPWPDS